MLYSDSRRLAFVHIQKTGGTSLRRILTQAVPDMAHLPELPGAHHTTSELFATLQQRDIDPLSVRVLAMVRNPLHQVVSIYRFWRSKGLSPEEEALPKIVAVRQQTFSEFVETTIKHDDYAYMLLVDGALPPNVEVVRLEEAQQDANVLREASGIPDLPPLPLVHVTDEVNTIDPSPARDGFSSYYNPHTEGIVRRAYGWTYASGLYL